MYDTYVHTIYKRLIRYYFFGLLRLSVNNIVVYFTYFIVGKKIALGCKKFEKMSKERVSAKVHIISDRTVYSN